MTKISIITATYNSEREIQSTYNSIALQSFTDWEWLVTDDCSSDNTVEVLKDIASQDDRVRVRRLEKNSGAAVARNSSIARARGTYLAFIDSDDVWKPGKLELQIEMMEKHSLDFTFTAYELIDENGSPTGTTVDSTNVSKFSYNDMLKKKATMGCSTVIIRKDAYSDVMMPLLRTGQDYALWLKLLKTGKEAYLLSKVLTQYRILPNSISRNKLKKAKRQWQIYREIECLGLVKSLYCFSFYAFRAVFRKP